MLAASGPPPSPGLMQIFGVSGPSSIGHLRGVSAAFAISTDCARAAAPTPCIIFLREKRNSICEPPGLNIVQLCRILSPFDLTRDGGLARGVAEVAVFKLSSLPPFFTDPCHQRLPP